MNENKRKYNSKYRKKLALSIKKINNNDIYLQIYNIILKDIGNIFSQNNNGIFFNINIISDTAIYEINNLVSQELNTILSSENTQTLVYTPYSIDENAVINELGPRLSNQEKSLLKKIKFK